MRFQGIATLVRENRLKTGVSQSELSAALGYKNGQFISNVERGLCSVPLKQLPLICKTLNIKPDDAILEITADFRKHAVEVFNASAQL